MNNKLVVIFVSLFTVSAWANTAPDEIIQSLLNGNKMYRESSMLACSQKTNTKVRSELAKGQSPSTIILSCSDSRVPPELIFDKGLGEIFVIRVAGNVTDPVILGSIEYAAEHLKSSLIVVLGHERCGAVTAAVNSKKGDKLEGNIGAIVKQIAPAVLNVKKSKPELQGPDLVEAAVLENIHLVAQNLTKKSKTLAHLVEKRELKIVEAKYDLDDGQVNFIENK